MYNINSSYSKLTYVTFPYFFRNESILLFFYGDFDWTDDRSREILILNQSVIRNVCYLCIYESIK